jgi:hypothetical protein
MVEFDAEEAATGPILKAIADYQVLTGERSQSMNAFLAWCYQNLDSESILKEFEKRGKIDGYEVSQVRELIVYKARVRGELQDLMLRNVIEGETLSDQGAREYLHRGVGRRLNVIHLAISRIYDLFPPSRQLPLPKATLNEVQVYQHALSSAFC